MLTVFRIIKAAGFYKLRTPAYHTTEWFNIVRVHRTRKTAIIVRQVPWLLVLLGIRSTLQVSYILVLQLVPYLLISPFDTIKDGSLNGNLTKNPSKTVLYFDHIDICVTETLIL